LDEASAATLLTTDNKLEVLPPEDFRDWTHAGDTPKNPWRQHDLIGGKPEETGDGFVNSYKPESGVKKILTEKGYVTTPKGKVDEFEWFVQPGSKLAESAVTQHVSERFRKGTDVMVNFTDNTTSADHIAVLEGLGFKRAYQDVYPDGVMSDCWVLDRSTYARVMLEKMATKSYKGKRANAVKKR
jgi:hypothetical protein